MKKTISLLISIFMLVSICSFSSIADQPNVIEYDFSQVDIGIDNGIAKDCVYSDEVVIDNVVYARKSIGESKANYFTVIKLFDNKETAKTATQINIVDKIGDIPVLTIEPISDENRCKGYGKKIETIKLPDSIKFIGIRAFDKFYNVKSLNLPSNLEGFGFQALARMIRLEKVTIPATVKNIPGGLFYKCRKLKTVKFKGNNIKSLEASAFAGCINLEAITIPGKVTAIGDNCFSNCRNLKKVVIKANKINIGGSNGSAFTKCPKLKTIKINAKTVKVESKLLKSLKEDCKIYVKTKNAKTAVKKAGFKGKIIIK